MGAVAGAAAAGVDIGGVGDGFGEVEGHDCFGSTLVFGILFKDKMYVDKVVCLWPTAGHDGFACGVSLMC